MSAVAVWWVRLLVWAAAIVLGLGVLVWILGALQAHFGAIGVAVFLVMYVCGILAVSFVDQDRAFSAVEN